MPERPICYYFHNDTANEIQCYGERSADLRADAIHRFVEARLHPLQAQ